MSAPCTTRSTSRRTTPGPTTLRVHRRRPDCRLCGSEHLHCILSLGSMPLANAFLSTTEAFAHEPRYPLDVYFCERCSLVQLLDVIAPEVLFQHYLYRSGFSSIIGSHNSQLARLLIERLNLGRLDLVVEVASNDGSLLRCFHELGVRTLGIEPATNLAHLAQEQGLTTINEFFDATTAARVRETAGPAKAVIANNVLAHVDDPVDFLRGVRHLLHHDGLAVFEVPYLGDLLEKLEYDTIYHEHLSYFSVTALVHLCERAGLVIAGIDHLPVHGGSLRVYARRDDVPEGHGRSVLDMAQVEAATGVIERGRLERFASAVQENRTRLLALLREIRASGRTVAGYGAPAKGNTLLNYCGIDRELLPYVVDRNPLKVGLYTPGTHIPVLPVSTLAERRPDFLLILPWNLAAEVAEQQAEYRRAGGAFLVPIPEPRVI